VDLMTTRRMGNRIPDFVREHHGTGCMRVFQKKAAALGRLGRDDETYCYDGPSPRSPETAIVMMADQLEATARSAPPNDEAGCLAIIDRTIDRITAEGQLRNAGLTGGDLAHIRTAFADALMAMHHRRLTYPPPTSPQIRQRRLALIPKMIGRSRG
jgi:membrane-associated HD superfamily phosphohydrolase